jgi:transcriptional regulator with XRE-family HTH domain
VSRTPHARRVAELAILLTALRETAGLTFAALAAATGLSETTLKRASCGTDVPQEATVTAYLRACSAGTDAERLLMRAWRAARAEQRGKLAHLQAPAVENIRTQADLSAALAAAYEEAGAPSLRVLRERAGTEGTAGTFLLPKTTAWRIIRRTGRPTDWRQCAAFLRACGITGPRLDLWHQAWDRAQSHTVRTPEATAAIERRLAAHARARQSVEPLQRLLVALPADITRDVIARAMHDATSAVVARNGAPLPGTTPAQHLAFLLQSYRAVEDHRAPHDAGIDTVMVTDDGHLFVSQIKHSGQPGPPLTGAAVPTNSPPPAPRTAPAARALLPISPQRRIIRLHPDNTHATITVPVREPA